MAATEKKWYTKFIGVRQYLLKNKLFKYYGNQIQIGQCKNTHMT